MYRVSGCVQVPQKTVSELVGCVQVPQKIVSKLDGRVQGVRVCTGAAEDRK